MMMNSIRSGGRVVSSLTRHRVARNTVHRAVCHGSRYVTCRTVRPTAPHPLPRAALFTTSSSSYPPHEVLCMPALSPTMESGSIGRWNVREGGAFAAGDSLCEVQTDKATVDLEAQDDGVLAKILQEAGGADVPVGTPICVVVEEEADGVVAAFAGYGVATAGEDTTSSTGETTNKVEDVVSVPSHGLGDFVLMPAARHHSQSRGVDATVLYPGSGRNGRVTKGDVILAMQNGTDLPQLSSASVTNTEAVLVEEEEEEEEEAPVETTVTPTPPAPTTLTTSTTVTASTTPLPPPPSPPSPSLPFHDVPNNKMRQIIASRLTQSKADVPHFYTQHSIALDDLLALRSKLKQQFDLRFSVNDAVIRAAALALRDVPEMTASFDQQTQGVTLPHAAPIDISVAVATPTGLMTPIVTDAPARGLSDISSTVRDLAARAQTGKLAPEEYQGGTFTISNLGMFGISAFAAVINPPQCAILAVGGGVRTVVPGSPGEKKARVATLMEATVSADRRVVDEATVGLFLQTLGNYLSKPELLLL